MSSIYHYASLCLAAIAAEDDISSLYTSPNTAEKSLLFEIDTPDRPSVHVRPWRKTIFTENLDDSYPNKQKPRLLTRGLGSPRPSAFAPSSTLCEKRSHMGMFL
jgi:hypothetical protein